MYLGRGPCLFNHSLCSGSFLLSANASLASVASNSVTPWTVARQARQEYWSGLRALLQGIFPTQGLNPHLLCLLRWQVSFSSLVPLGKLHPLLLFNTILQVCIEHLCWVHSGNWIHLYRGQFLIPISSLLYTSNSHHRLKL